MDLLNKKNLNCFLSFYLMLKIKITFLGTGGMVPTKERNHSGILLSYKNENILIDCGEGTQRQLKFADISSTKITKILISHWHGDHVLGIPGLLYSLAANEYNKTLEIYGPKGTKEFMYHLLKGFSYKNPIKCNIYEIEEGTFFENPSFKLEAKKLDHKCLCLGYSFIEKDRRNINIDYLKKNFNLSQHPLLKKLHEGKDITWKGKIIKANKATKITPGRKISFVSDTAFCQSAIDLAKNADILICESTYSSDLEEKAKEYKHLTVNQAAEVAKKAKAKRLILTHFSQRYKDVQLMVREAKKIFKNISSAKDLMVLEV